MSKSRVAVEATDMVIRLGLCACLEHQPQWDVSPLEQADVVVVAADTADAALLERLQALPLAEHAKIILVVNTGWHTDPSVAIGHGIRAVLWRGEVTRTSLLRTVAAVLAGHATLPPTLQGRLLDQIEYVQREVLGPRGLTSSGLTEREVDVLRLISEGLELSEIAAKMSYSERTIKKALSSVLGRLGLRNRVHAVAYAIRAGLI